MADSDPETGKRQLRIEAMERRADARAKTGPLAGDLLATQFLEHIGADERTIIAGYWPINDEITPAPLMKRLHLDGCAVALPAVIERQDILQFRGWEPDLALEPGPYGTSHPPGTMGEVVPTIVLVPLLAFDADGRRLGYGAGFYDRTIRALRAEGEVLAVGCAFEAQRVEQVPSHDGDERLDWVVTENNAHRFA
ncbi:MAG: 5-formyltetrahydrofolate cyclo-ligase [Proteobacteria bacterium]|nr:5-formyltetrahydrofolate cyclo-ligase [Pseudomonadota bacterium]